MTYIPIYSLVMWFIHYRNWRRQRNHVYKSIAGSEALTSALENLGFNVHYISGVFTSPQLLDKSVETEDEIMAVKKMIWSRIKNVLFPVLERLQLLDSVSIDIDINGQVAIVRMFPPDTDVCRHWQLGALISTLLTVLLTLGIIVLNH